MKLDFNRVQAQFLEDTFELDLIRCDVEILLLKCRNDFRGTHRAIQMTFVIGIGFDSNALLAERIGE